MAQEKKGFYASLDGAFKTKNNKTSDLQEIDRNKQVNTELPVKQVNIPVKKKNDGEPVFVKYTAEINVEYLEMLEREAFWERTTAKAIINEQMEARYKGKTFDPIPESKRPTKRGPKKKK